MIKHTEISDADLRIKIIQNEICLGGNEKLKIYGTLHCKSGKRMKRENRVFFVDEQEAITHGYRPCGHCKKDEYQKWIYLTRKQSSTCCPTMAS
jgi:methylphosphotriester-DNA--protein-cysteine methyltransferase